MAQLSRPKRSIFYGFTGGRREDKKSTCKIVNSRLLPVSPPSIQNKHATEARFRVLNMADDRWYEKPEDLTSSPLIAAAVIGDLDTVQSLFAQGYPNKNETTNHNSTVINIAAWKGHLEVVRFLAENGVDYEKVDKMGYSALHVAAVGGHLDVLVYLAEQGADKNRTCADGKTPIITAAKSKHFDIVRYLAKNGVDVDKADDSGLTPLVAVLNTLHNDGHLDAVRCLVEQGADVDKADSDGQSPLFLASYHVRSEVVGYLLEQGANVNKTDKDGRTPLIATIIGTIMYGITSATKKKILDIVTCLVEQGAEMERLITMEKLSLFMLLLAVTTTLFATS